MSSGNLWGTAMNAFSKLARAVTTVLGLTAALPACAADVEELLDTIRMPSGFQIEVYARVPGARSMAVVDALGVVFVGTRGDAVFAVVDADGDGTPERTETVRRGLKVPNGIAWRDGILYVAEQHRVVRFRCNDLETLRSARPEVLFDGLPDDSWHGWRYAAFAPDGSLFVTVGAPCNVCEVEGLEGTIVRFQPAGGDPEVYAQGVRNSVGMDFHPRSGDLYFTDNGADMMGDDVPPDELNHAPRPGLHFGYPYFGGGDARTDDFRERTPPATTSPVVGFGAHVAALGVHFYRGTRFPGEYRGDAFVAQHGSWNRTVPDGYRVARVRFDGQGRAASREIFADGWLRGGGAWGRPVDVKELADGSLLVSDDRSGTIFRITYDGH